MRFPTGGFRLLALSVLGFPAALSAQQIAVNDNRVPAGRIRGGVVEAALEVTRGQWRPRGADGPALSVMAFAEAGRPAQNPGPLLRARAGQTLQVSLHNRTGQALTVFGLGPRRGTQPDTFTLAAGDRRTVRFPAPPPGTYFYAAVHPGHGLLERADDDSQLNGFLIVDPAEGPAFPDERFFLISWWFQDPDTTGAARKPALGTMVINGLTWPSTESFNATVGDTLRWRWLNLTEANHPMHLHGFYFRVTARADTAFPPEQQRAAVTETVAPGRTLALEWTPERPGNWLFHCHFAFHISHNVGLSSQADFTDVAPAGHAGHGMSGLAMAIHVRQRQGTLATVAHREPRPLRLLIRSRPGGYGTHPAYGYALDGSPEAARPNGFSVPGPTLVLERGQPVAVTIVNQSHEAAAVHWHGIELESFPDGVPNFSGEGQNLLRPIPPGDSLTVRFTPPRAGTFMYHSHFNELQQIASGLYGALLVLPPGESVDPVRDHTFVFSTGGVPTLPAPILLNGQAQHGVIRLRAGVTHRLRLVNIMANGGVTVSLRRGGEVVPLTLVAKDGADLPPAQRTARGPIRIFAGEIYDVEVTPEAGALTLQYVRGPDFAVVQVPVQVAAPQVAAVP